MSELSTLPHLISRFIDFIPQLLLALAGLFLGLVLAKISKRAASRLVSASLASKVLDNTPIDLFLENADLKHKLDEIVGTFVYWLVLMLALYVSAGVLGLYSLVNLLGRLFAYLPNFVSAGVVLLVGVILAGFVEKMSKSALASHDAKTGRLVGKISSYLVISLTMMIAISELGIARDFILILFIGLVLAFTISFGLAVGLGAQETVRQILERWSKNQKG